MYSVIIQNQKTLDIFHEFQPLFMEAIKEKKIGVCRWIESGNTVDSALPGLSDLTDNKEAWRAVIVRVEDETAMQEFEYDEDNPYDFLVNKKNGSCVEESVVPLIRLTHILGGMPKPEVKFEAVKVEDGETRARMVYRTVINSEENEKFRYLEEKYSFDGKRPEEIILMTIRRHTHSYQESISKVWRQNREIQSSDFWKRNNYATKCRYLLFDMIQSGPYQKQADMFEFWTSVLLVAANDLEAGCLQAYKVYNIRTKFNKELMTNKFQSLFEKLQGSKKYIEESFLDYQKRREEDRTVSPSYQVRVPIAPDLKKQEEGKKIKFGLISKGKNDDASRWTDLKKNWDMKLVEVVKKSERALDEGVIRFKKMWPYKKEEVFVIDKFQKCDMEEALDGVYHDIMMHQQELPSFKKKNKNEIKELEKKILLQIFSRVNWVQVFSVLLISCVLTCVYLMPMLCWGEALLTREKIIYIGIGTMFLYILSELIILAWQKFKFVRMIKKYGELRGEEINKVMKNVDVYTNFISAVGSFIRGKTFLKLEAVKEKEEDNEYDEYYVHISAIENLLEKLKIWSESMHVTLHQSETYTKCEVDLYVEPEKNYLYTFQHGERYKVALKGSEDIVYAPFDFVKQLEIKREELYDDKVC